ncbi:MAG: glycoside hydrolase family 36 N-terminal domain-containing protein [Lachnospiraceae bacterium]
MPYGDSVLYPGGGAAYCLDVLPMEWSGAGRGDYRPSPIELVTDAGSWTADFEYAGHTITSGATQTKCGLPTAYGGDMTLAVLLRDEAAGAELRLYYTTYPAEDVITRRAELVCTRCWAEHTQAHEPQSGPRGAGAQNDDLHRRLDTRGAPLRARGRGHAGE